MESKIVNRCELDERGIKHCERVRVNPNGTEIELAGVSFQLGATCGLQIEESWENYKGELKKLQGVIDRDIKACQKTPSDY